MQEAMKDGAKGVDIPKRNGKAKRGGKEDERERKWRQYEQRKIVILLVSCIR